MKGFLLGVVKLILGVSLAMVLLSLAGVATARYFMAKLSVLPPKPVFNNDAIAQSAPQASTAPVPAAATPAALPPGSYEAVVVQPRGLVLRAGPGEDQEQLGGVDNNEAVIVLASSDDGSWLHIRIKSNGQEGWVKAGNTEQTGSPASAQ